MYLSDECLVRTLCPIPELRNKQLQSSLSPARQRTFTLSSFLSFYGSGIASFKNDKMMGTDCYLIEVLICIFYWWVAQHIGCLIFLFWSWSVPVFFSYFLMIYCIVITYMYMCAPVCLFMLVQVPAEARKRCQISWSWSHMPLWATWSGCWEQNSDLPE